MARITGNDLSNSLAGTAEADLIYGFDPAGAGRAVTQIEAARIAAGLSQPLFLAAAPGDPTRLFVVEKGGQIEILDAATGVRAATPFLDVTGQIATASEQGLLGMAFHPDVAANGRVFVCLINLAGDTEIREYRIDPANPNRVDPASARAILTIDQPAQFTNHKGGWLGFGPDGRLYIASGDGGGGGDPLGSGQNLNTLLGKMLRIDVDADGFPADPARNYAIPADNPFVGVAGLDEIWAHGLRNPWRNSFDRATGQLFIADVGQAAREEINLGIPGANYGWNAYEGSLPFSGAAVPGTTFPIHEYGRGVGGSITGGYVYRGESEGLHGQYIFADFVSDRVFSLAESGGGWAATDRTAQLVYTAGGSVSAAVSFGEDAEGSLYLVDIDGEVFRLTPRLASADRADTVHAGGGDDTVYGGAGNDTLRGQAGDDTLYGMTGNDTVEGGDGDDLLFGGAGNDTMRGEAGADTLSGGAGDDVINGGAGADRIFGGAGRDMASWWGSDAAVRVNLAAGTAQGGHAQGDRLHGIEDLRGSRHADTLTGDAGANRLEGWEGNDLLAGGGGADLFVILSLWHGTDRIADFSQAEGDRLDVSALLGATVLAWAGAGAHTGGGVASARYQQSGGDTVVFVDTGDGVADLRVLLTGSIALSAADLVL